MPLDPRRRRHRRRGYPMRRIGVALAMAGIAVGAVQCAEPALVHKDGTTASAGGVSTTTEPPQPAAMRPSWDDTGAPNGSSAIDGRRYMRSAGDRVTVFAHRGAPTLAPENTLPSDEAARHSGADWIENDVQPSRDGVPHIMHDETVDRTTDGHGRIRDLTSAQLAGLDAGKWFRPEFAGTKVMTLRGQLADLRSRGGRLLLEIKNPQTREEIARIVDEVRHSGMSDRVFVQSFDRESLRITRDLAPDLPLGLLGDADEADPVALARELRLTSYNPSYYLVAKHPDLVRRLHAAGVAVFAWTPDDPNEWSKLHDAGVDGIITNRSADLVAWNGKHTPGKGARH
ncbi:glycerophosphodiester phosphodiesterase [Embleya sp. NPDC020630]|uniref:glycerophosphodiester phosphodiesterase n=1 Tax=Embleya sp. NPDC020630 TaxID=3363979 RepID=UPI0037A13452